MTVSLATLVFTGLAGGVAGLGFLFALLRYVIRAETSELRNNGGSTIKDAVDRIDTAAKVAAEHAKSAATMAKQTKDALDDHVGQALAAQTVGRRAEAEIRALIKHGQEADDEIRGTISTLADAVKIAAQSTPPEEHS